MPIKSMTKMIKKMFLRKRKVKFGKRTLGFTMIELLLVMAILALLSAGGVSLYSTNSSSARDARRLADMKELAVALDGYYDDNGCYPEENVVNTCGGTGLLPYLKEVSCDPSNSGDFQYVYERENCSTYRIYLNFEDTSNEQITLSGCNEGCGPNNAYNYMASSSNVAVDSSAGGVSPTCGSGSNLYCFANACSTCCPGVNYRCAPSGELCIVDTTCQ